MNVAILGFGEYGKALASVFLDNTENKVRVWNKFEREFLNLDEKYLRGTYTTDLRLAVENAHLVVIAVPVLFLDDLMREFKEIYEGQDIVIASKGIEVNEGLFAVEIVRKYLGEIPLGVISGGTFASDMKNGYVMGITLGSEVSRIRNRIRNFFECDFLKVQYIDDVMGVSVCGAIKNVMAIGFGMLDGANYPPSSKFLFLTEAIYEIRNLIKFLGGDEKTVMTYAGIDDIMMTCTSVESRNYRLGFMIGKGSSNEEIEEYKSNTTIEGLGTAKAIYKKVLKMEYELPITSVIYKILYEDGSIEELVKLLEKRES